VSVTPVEINSAARLYLFIRSYVPILIVANNDRYTKSPRYLRLRKCTFRVRRYVYICVCVTSKRDENGKYINANRAQLVDLTDKRVIGEVRAERVRRDRAVP